MGHWTPTGVEPKDYDDDDDEGASWSSANRWSAGKYTTWDATVVHTRVASTCDNNFSRF